MNEFSSPVFLAYYAVPPALTLWGSIYLVRRSKQLSTVLLFIGGVLNVILAILTITSSLALRDASYSSSGWITVTHWSIWIGMASSSIFAVGFFLYARRQTHNS
jgi:hypothetical protein